MRKSLLIGLALAVVLAGAPGAQVKVEKPAGEPAAPAPASAESVALIQALVPKMESRDARVRFAVREALVVMGPQAIPLLNEHKAATENVHLKAFVDRTLARLKSIRTVRGRSYSTLRGRDLDRLAMQCNLTLEQITRIVPILAKHDKNVKDLWEEFRESGGAQDREAYKDLREEMKLLVEEAEPSLRKYLNDAQVKTVTAQLKSGGTPGMGGGGMRILGGPGGGVTIIRPGGGGGKSKSR